MGKSKIEWCDETWNPVRGCNRVSPGCRHCYAEAIAARFSGPGQSFEGYARRVGGEPRWTGKVDLLPHKLAEPLSWRKPRRVFVNSMSDLFHEDLTTEQIAAVFAVMAAAPSHTFQVLTKRPERARAWFGELEAQPGMVPHASVRGCVLALAKQWPRGEQPDRIMEVIRSLSDGVQEPPPWPLPNVWLGTSVEDQATADERIPHLRGCPAAVRFVSYEPALGPVSFKDGPLDPEASTMGPWVDLSGIHQVIAGGESGPGARPCDIQWFRDVRDECREAGVAFFMKQVGARPVVPADEEVLDWGTYVGWETDGPESDAPPKRPFELRTQDPKGGDPAEWPEDLRVRMFPGDEWGEA